MITAVFFDLYGTLANFQPSRFEVQSQACLEFGIKITEEGTIRGYKLADAYMSKENSIFPISTRSKNQRDQFFWEYEKLILEGNDVTVSIEMAGSIWNTLRKIPYKLVLFPDVVPEINKIKSFVIPPKMGINYKPGVWHFPLITTEDTDFLVIDRKGSGENLTIHKFEKEKIILEYEKKIS